MKPSVQYLTHTPAKASFPGNREQYAKPVALRQP